MRLTPSQQQSILQTVSRYFGYECKVWLFGSRVDPNKVGGDIDLLVELPNGIQDECWQRAQLQAALQLALGEQHIDLLLQTPLSAPLPIQTIAKQEGILLNQANESHSEQLRLITLLDLVRREVIWLQRVDTRLQQQRPDLDWLNRLEGDDAASEMLESFVSRFARLQDNLGDKLIPASLRAVAEKTGSAIDNLQRAEKLGWLWSTQDWLAARNLCNQMVHDYIPNPVQMLLAIQHAHLLVPKMTETYNLINQYLSERSRQEPWPALV